ncbi:NERD domain-containing protein [Cellulomonas sp. URHB0016]
MEEVLTVRRWRRYGADRLFVTEETGAMLGSVDLQSGEVVADDPEREAGLRRAAQAWLRTDARADVTELVLPVPTAPSDALDAFDEAALEAWLGSDSRDVPDDRYRSGRASSVRTRLDRLTDEGWEVVRDVPLGRQGDMVGHLLIGPGGIFTVSERREAGRTCHADGLTDEDDVDVQPGHRGRPGSASTVVLDGRQMIVDGVPVAALRVARLEASRVQGHLLAAAIPGISVRGVIVVHGDLEIVGVVGPEDPLVVHRTDVPGLFRQMPVRLDPARARAIAQIARRRRTWSH